MPCLDANIILRYVLDDHAELSPKAKIIIGESDIETPREILCEVVYILARIYKINRKDIADTLLDFFSSTNCNLPHREAIIKAIEYYGVKNLDFVDCILAGYLKTENTSICSFDEKLEKVLLSISKELNESYEQNN